MLRSAAKKPGEEWCECELFRAFHAACTSGDPKSALQTFTAWLGHSCLDLKYGSIRQFSQAIGNKRFSEQLLELREAAEFPDLDWAGEELYAAVIEARNELSDIHPSSG